MSDEKQGESRSMVSVLAEDHHIVNLLEMYETSIRLRETGFPPGMRDEVLKQAILEKWRMSPCQSGAGREPTVDVMAAVVKLDDLRETMMGWALPDQPPSNIEIVQACNRLRSITDDFRGGMSEEEREQPSTPLTIQPSAEYIAWTVTSERNVFVVGTTKKLPTGLRVWRHRMGAVTHAEIEGVVWSNNLPLMPSVAAVVLDKPWSEGAKQTKIGVFTMCPCRFAREVESGYQWD